MYSSLDIFAMSVNIADVILAVEFAYYEDADMITSINDVKIFHQEMSDYYTHS